MSGYRASCPSCGGEIVFELGASLLKVCDHCGVAVARKGADLASYGKVAALIPTPSVLALGLEGGYAGAPRFRLVGRLQLDHGSGTWDEWLMAFDDGQWAWLSESQGKFHYMGRAPMPPVPAYGALHVGATVDLGPPGTFVVAELRRARFVTAQGELPFDVEPGSPLYYADLSGPGGGFATLDFGTGSEAEAVYVGREVTLEDMGMKGLPSPEDRRKKTGGQSLSCPQCGGPLEVRAPDQTQRIACPYCGSLLDATKDLAVLEALNKVPVKPVIPLGTRGRLSGVDWTVIGFMERSATVDGIRYPWREYLLYEERRGFRWLVESKGHWSFIEPVPPGDVRESWGLAARYADRTFKHFQSSFAKVDHVVGEFYWAVARGDETETADYIDPPGMLSMEKTAEEVSWSLGTYLEPSEVWKAFRLDVPQLERSGVGMNQPSPYGDAASRAWIGALLAAAAVVVIFFYFLFTGGRVIHQQTVEIPAALTAPSAVNAVLVGSVATQAPPEAAAFIGPIVIPAKGNLRVEVSAPVNNSWLYLDGALINDDTGEIDDFDLEVSVYSGVEDGESWSEGRNEAHTYIPSVAPGRYTMRLAPQWELGKAPARYDVAVKSRVPRFSHLLMTLVALFAWPVVAGWRKMRFESQRWSESDHAWSGSGSDDDSGGEDDE